MNFLGLALVSPYPTIHYNTPDLEKVASCMSATCGNVNTMRKFANKITTKLSEYFFCSTEFKFFLNLEVTFLTIFNKRVDFVI